MYIYIYIYKCIHIYIYIYTHTSSVSLSLLLLSLSLFLIFYACHHGGQGAAPAQVRAPQEGAREDLAVRPLGAQDALLGEELHGGLGAERQGVRRLARGGRQGRPGDRRRPHAYMRVCVCIYIYIMY